MTEQEPYEPSAEEIENAEGHLTESEAKSSTEREAEAETREKNSVFFNQGYSEDGMYFDFLAYDESRLPDDRQRRVSDGMMEEPVKGRSISADDYVPWLNNQPLALLVYARRPELREITQGLVVTERVDEREWGGGGFLHKQVDEARFNTLLAYQDALRDLRERIGDNEGVIQELQGMSRQEYLDWLYSVGLVGEKIDGGNIPEKSKTVDDALHKSLELVTRYVPDLLRGTRVVSTGGGGLNLRFETKLPYVDDNSTTKLFGSFRFASTQQYGGGVSIALLHRETGGLIKVNSGSITMGWHSFEEFAKRLDEELEPALKKVFGEK